jgi:hypothetical protein
MADATIATVIIGDSHYAAIANAAQNSLAFAPDTRGCDLIFFDAWKYSLNYPFTVEAGDQSVLNPQLADWITILAGNYDRIQLFSLMGGGHHQALTLLDNGHPIEVILPAQPNLPVRDDATLLSHDFVKDIFLQLIASSFKVMECLRRAFPDLPYSQIECPPANGDNIFIRGHLGRYFEDNFPPEQLERLSTPAQRYKFWVLQSEMYADKCAELGIDYMRVPESAIGDDGFLKPEHYGQDSTHANADYGRVILDSIEAGLGRRLNAWNSFG